MCSLYLVFKIPFVQDKYYYNFFRLISITNFYVLVLICIRGLTKLLIEL
jgi:hypothetical protein